MLIIQDDEADANTRLTYFDITDRPPTNVAWARLQFSKAAGSENATLEIDQVILTPVASTNLLQNPSFELGFTGWNAPLNFAPNFGNSFAGMAEALTEGEGILSQDVRIDNLPDNSSFLFSFAANSNEAPVLSAVVAWLDAADNVIGVPSEGGVLFQDISLKEAEGHCYLFNFGFRSNEAQICNTLAEVRWLDARGIEIGLGLSIVIPKGAAGQFLQWLVYTGITEPAPPGTAKARVQFTKAAGILSG
ncbi:hypothetical protein V6C27_06825 [Peptococcaceae bacterium 1198_IL3148]